MLRHLLLWIIITGVSIIALPGLIEPQTYVAKIKADQTMLANDIGEQSADYIIRKSNYIYKQMFEESGIQPWMYERYQIGKHDATRDLLGENALDKMGAFAEKYTVSFFISMYEAVFRLTQLFYWAMFALPFVIASAFDGLMQRKVRTATFQYSSPAAYNAMWHFLIALISCTTIYCNTPFAMPAIAFPMLVFAGAMAIRILLSNLQRSA